MAKYTITHTCGHEGTFTLFGAMKDRDKKLAYLATLPCQECKKAVNVASNAEVGLEGSEKQIAWAMDIRSKALREIEGIINGTSNDEERAEAEQAKAKLEGVKSAKWLIDNRDSLTSRHSIGTVTMSSSSYWVVRNVNEMIND